MITLIRASKGSEFGIKFKSQAIAVDKHNVLLFLIRGKKVNWDKPKFVKRLINNEKQYYNFNE